MEGPHGFGEPYVHLHFTLVLRLNFCLIALAKRYKKVIEDELISICREVYEITTKLLIPSATEPIAVVFYKKLLADYYRYMAEVRTGEDKKQCGLAAEREYHQAFEIANKSLPATDSIRLNLALNYSVFLFEIMKKKLEACHLAKSAFDDAILELDSVAEETYREATLIMQLLRDNLTLWRAQVGGIGEPGGSTTDAAMSEAPSVK